MEQFKYYLVSDKLVRIYKKFIQISNPIPLYKDSEIIDDVVYAVEFEDWEDFKKNYDMLVSSDSPVTYGVYARSIGGAFVNVDEITLDGIRKNGIGSEIERYTGLTTETNIANVIGEICKNEGLTPIELFNTVHP